MPRQLTTPWYNAFVNCTLPHTEAPRNYLFWSAISVLGGILKNNVYFKDGLYTLYPNQFIILTGPPGIGKGTAINFAWKLIKGQNSPLANVLTDKITGPKILHLIADGWASAPQLINGQAILATKEHTCTIIASELQSMLSSGDDMLSQFCQLWDQAEYEYRTKNQGSAIIKGMCVSLIGGTVPDYVRGMEHQANAAIAGGFSARCIFIFEDKKSKELPYAPTIEETPASAALYDKLKNDLIHIAHNVRGEFKINDEARIVFSNFYPATSPLAEDSDAMLNFKGRMRTHIWKMAMILSAARKDRMIIEAQDVRDSIYLVTTVRRQLDKVFRGIGSSQLAEPTARVQQVIEKFGMCTKQELVKATHRHLDPATLDRVLFVLETIGFCTTQKVGTKVYFKQVPKIIAGTGLGTQSKGVNMP
jgi:hypothetical protein